MAKIILPIFLVYPLRHINRHIDLINLILVEHTMELLVTKSQVYA